MTALRVCLLGGVNSDVADFNTYIPEVAAPARRLAALLALGGGTVVMLAVGMLIAATAPTTNAARGIGLLALLVMAGLGGLFISRDTIPDWLAVLGDHLPLGATTSLVSAAWSGEALQLSYVIALAACGVVAAVLAVRFFRWE